ncbi:MAG: L,D-transpeptidase [Bauldia sp.]|nr:L,D-transpeptidase [Bauldia sp.]
MLKPAAPRHAYSRQAGLLASLFLMLLAAGCASTTPPPAVAIETPVKVIYAAIADDDGFKIPAVNIRRIDPRFLRQVVDTPANIPGAPGTIVVDPANRFLYLVSWGGKSIRYGIGVGREGFAWSGAAVIKDKQHWPKWFPPKEMVDRDPRLKPYADGMDGGPSNPLGARALYLWADNKDTLYRIHGTNEPSSIGKAVSSGCVRMLDQDIIDLYERVPLGTKVIVLDSDGTTPLADMLQGPASPALPRSRG